VNDGDHDHRTGTMHILEPLRNYWHELVIFGEKANANGVASRGFSPASAPHPAFSLGLGRRILTSL